MRYLIIILMGLMGYSYCQVQDSKDRLTKKDLKAYPRLDRFGNVDLSVIKQGKGSLLDADKLDGLDSVQFIRSESTVNVITTNLYINNGLAYGQYDSNGINRNILSLGSNDQLNIFSVGSMTFQTGSVVRMNIDLSGNLLLNNNTSLAFKDSGGIPRNVLTYDNTDVLSEFSVSSIAFQTGSSIKMYINLNGITTGGALCLNSAKALSKCTSQPDGSGNCTCP